MVSHGASLALDGSRAIGRRIPGSRPAGGGSLCSHALWRRRGGGLRQVTPRQDASTSWPPACWSTAAAAHRGRRARAGRLLVVLVQVVDVHDANQLGGVAGVSDGLRELARLVHVGEGGMVAAVADEEQAVVDERFGGVVVGAERL